MATRHDGSSKRSPMHAVGAKRSAGVWTRMKSHADCAGEGCNRCMPCINAGRTRLRVNGKRVLFTVGGCGLTLIA